MRIPRLLPLLVVFSLVSLSLPQSARAAAGRWTHAGPGGGEIRSLAIDPSDPRILHAAASPGGVYTSRNRGATWTWGAGQDVWVVAVDPGHPEIVYAGGPSTFVRSMDHGRTWTPLDIGRISFTIEALTIVPIPGNPSTVYAANVAELLVSRDAGESWEPVFQPGFAIAAIAIHPSDPDTIYLASFLGISKRTSAGSWLLASTGIPQVDRSRLRALVIDPRRPSRLYTVADQNFYRSDDAGAHWRRVGQIPQLLISRALAVDPEAPSTVWVAGDHGVFLSRDAGATWRPSAEGLPVHDLFGVDALAIDPENPRTLYAGTSGLGVARTFDGGRHWQLAPQPGLSAERILRLAFDRRNPGTLYVTLSPGIESSFRSEDGGRTWEPFASDLSRMGLSDVASEPAIPGMLWAANSEGVWISFDSGRTWERRDGTPAVHLALSGTKVLAAGTCGLRLGVRRGREWRQVLPCVLPGSEEVALSVARLLVDPHNPTRVYAVTFESAGTHSVSSRLLGSRDGGRVWQPLLEGIDAVAVGPNGTLYAAGDGAVRRSTDEGRTWFVVHEGGPQIRQLAVDAEDPLLVYASTQDAGVLRSEDGGVTWEPVNRGLSRLGRLNVGFLWAHPMVPGLVYAAPELGGLFQAVFE